LEMVCTGETVMVEVSDNGIGMMPDMVMHAFELFMQAERASDRAQGGLGLGLALVKGLVELHGGSATCQSAGLGQGSCFSISLPRLAQGKDDTAGSAIDGAVALPADPLRILVVDDNRDAAATLGMLLEVMGHQVLIAHDPYRALDLASTARPEVYMLDIGLPGLDGHELSRRLRARPENAGALLIALTG
ncbi:response regulator, partial [Halobellus sp. Atlit-31R]